MDCVFAFCPQQKNSKTGVWYGKCKDHGWVELNSEKHCPICVEKGMDPRVYKGTTYQA